MKISYAKASHASHASSSHTQPKSSHTSHASSNHASAKGNHASHPSGAPHGKPVAGHPSNHHTKGKPTTHQQTQHPSHANHGSTASTRSLDRILLAKERDLHHTPSASTKPKPHAPTSGHHPDTKALDRVLLSKEKTLHPQKNATVPYETAKAAYQKAKQAAKGNQPPHSAWDDLKKGVSKAVDPRAYQQSWNALKRDATAAVKQLQHDVQHAVQQAGEAILNGAHQLKETVANHLPSIHAFTEGTLDAVKENYTYGAYHGYPTYGHERAYAAGKLTGDLATTVSGALETAVGLSEAAGGGLLTLGSGGAGAIVGTPAIAAGGAFAAHGLSVAGSSMAHLGQEAKNLYHNAVNHDKIPGNGNLSKVGSGQQAITKGMGEVKLTPTSTRGTGETLKRTFDVGGTKVEINSGHGYRESGHRTGNARDVGSMDEIESAILSDVKAAKQAGVTFPKVPKSVERTVHVNGQTVGYSVTQTSDGTVRISTYYPK